jgi:hypothetical protein
MTVTRNTGKQKIDALDLSRIRGKLIDPNGEYAWADEKADLAISEYRDFLQLIFLYPHERLVPGPGVDEVWHMHVLDTRKYAADCNQIFGYFVHHIPSYGDDSSPESNARERTVALYQAVFNRTPNLSTCGACCCGEAIGDVVRTEEHLVMA